MRDIAKWCEECGRVMDHQPGETLDCGACREVVGKIVTFKAITRWSGSKATRQIRGVRADGAVLVRFGGWTDFIVRPNEIISIERRRDQ